MSGGDPFLDRVAEALRRPVSPPRGARERARRAVLARTAAPPRGAALAWLLTPRLVAIRPATLLVAAAALAAILLVGPALLGDGAPAVPPDGRAVQFVFVGPDAHSVTLVGNFNDWDTTATPLQRGARDGLWSVVVPLPPGRHTYAFVVDGERWQVDAGAPLAPEDDFGRPSSVVVVERPVS